jgi:hypothetical protein
MAEAARNKKRRRSRLSLVTAGGRAFDFLLLLWTVDCEL